MANRDWDATYTSGGAPWDIGRPQPAFERLADAGEITSPVLDCGCGTGEHALLLAERGMEVLGVDVAPTAIARARAKAVERKLTAGFAVADAMALDRLGRTFATVIDCGLFHVFDDTDRPRYAASLASVLDPGGVFHVLCFSEHTPGDRGPRRVTQAELHATFADGWEVSRIEPARIEVKRDCGRPAARLAGQDRPPVDEQTLPPSVLGGHAGDGQADRAHELGAVPEPARGDADGGRGVGLRIAVHRRPDPVHQGLGRAE